MSINTDKKPITDTRAVRDFEDKKDINELIQELHDKIDELMSIIKLMLLPKPKKKQ